MRIESCLSFRSLEQIGLISRNSLKSLRGADHRHRALIAVHAAVVAYLEVKGAIAKEFAAFDTLATGDAQAFINFVFVIGFFNESTDNRASGTELVFRTSIQSLGCGFKESRTEIAVPAHFICIYALDGGFLQHAFGGAQAAGNAFGGINLPVIGGRLTPSGKESRNSAHTEQAETVKTLLQQAAPVERVFRMCHGYPPDWFGAG